MLEWIRTLAARRREANRQKWKNKIDHLKSRYHVFRSLLNNNTRAIDLVTRISITLRLNNAVSTTTVQLVRDLINETSEMVEKLNTLEPERHRLLSRIHSAIGARVEKYLKESSSRISRPVLIPMSSEKREDSGELDAGNTDSDRIDSVDIAAIQSDAGEIGNKAAALIRLKDRGFPVPDGFVITRQGCRQFLEGGALFMKLMRIMSRGYRGYKKEISPTLSDDLQESIRNAELPPELAEQIRRFGRTFFQQGKALAVRSSSSREDSAEHSFAGQFATVLNVRDERQLLRAFREVVASSFNSWSLSYSLHAGMDPLVFNMAILCLEMIPATRAGIAFSRDPQHPREETTVISAVLGLGKAAVDGSLPADVYYLNARMETDPDRTVIPGKDKRLVCLESGEIDFESVPVELRQKPVLGAKDISRLTALSAGIEREFERPQDIEWACTDEGEMVILQTRPLISGRLAPEHPVKISTTILMEGLVASGGGACGRVRIVRNRNDMKIAPAGPEILVLPQSYVEMVSILPLTQGVLVDLGSPLDHLACIAREQGVPMICALKDASRRLTEGDWVVMGAGGCVCTAGDDDILASQESWKKRRDRRKETAMELSPEVGRLQETITRLNLTDAYGPTFSIMECKSLHDVIRYVHEMATISMFHTGDDLLEFKSCLVHIIDYPLPFIFNVIDIGGGLALERPGKKRISPEEILSRPFQALWRGIVTPGLHWGASPGGNVGPVFSTWITDQKSERPVGMPNFVIVSRDYCNLNTRMDFHFAMLDAICGLDERNNHCKFRFKGGGTSESQRRRRVYLIMSILEENGFLTDVRDDLVTGSIQGGNADLIEEKLTVIGRLLGFTRLLDAALVDDETTDLAVQAFQRGDYALESIKSKSTAG